VKKYFAFLLTAIFFLNAGRVFSAHPEEKLKPEQIIALAESIQIGSPLPAPFAEIPWQSWVKTPADSGVTILSVGIRDFKKSDNKIPALVIHLKNGAVTSYHFVFRVPIGWPEEYNFPADKKYPIFYVMGEWCYYHLLGGSLAKYSRDEIVFFMSGKDGNREGCFQLDYLKNPVAISRKK
jgi:hypothetical protein